MRGRSVLMKIQTEILDMQSLKCFLPLLKNIQFPDLWSLDRQDRSWKGSWCFGWVSLKTHKYLEYFQHIFITQICKGLSVPNILKIFIGQTCLLLLISNANLSLARPLFEIFEQEWIPWFELHVVEIEVYSVTLGNTRGGAAIQCDVMHDSQCDSQAELSSCVTTCGDIKMGRFFFTFVSWPSLTSPVTDLWMLMSFWGDFGTNCICGLRSWISSDASNVSSASMSQRSDLPNPV